ncbi:thymidine phosphorylase family protein [Oleiagrimonas citrea]|uniref:Putative thymidine phosphorylase n=2 Tax=Oleiagrimonas citrea TaxID=1665687 RepID=A0A846ZNB3_9GAMM|nr:thymidine phosphorylase family protein [Oleiagrimonas citrea]
MSATGEASDMSREKGVSPGLKARRLGIDTHHEPVVVLRADAPVCRAEGFEAHARIEVVGRHGSIIATLNVLTTGELLAVDEVGLSESAWLRLKPEAGECLRFRHPAPTEAMSHIRAKIDGGELSERQCDAIVRDVVAGRLSNVEIAAFLVACADGRMHAREVTGLTRAMVNTGNRLSWPQQQVVDKHCIGGLPGNRTTPIVVPVATALGLVMPKTSSRAITSPAGTADTLETLTRVDLSLEDIRRVVEAEGGCMVWGGAVSLSPADDLLIRVERMLDLDSEGQLVASVLSKKAAAGSTHVLIDIPVGPTAKVRSQAEAESLLASLQATATDIGLTLRGLLSDGSQPIGRGIGPALEAHDVLAVLENRPDAPADLRRKALEVAAGVIELGGLAQGADALAMAERTLSDGLAWRKFQAICEAQGGLREPGRAPFTRVIPALHAGTVSRIDNRLLAQVARLAGAPQAGTAGVYLEAHVGVAVERGQPLFTVHAESRGELEYAMDFVDRHPSIVHVEVRA